MDDALTHAPVGVIETTSEGRITDANPAAASLVGASPGSLVGDDLRERFPRSAAGTLREAFAGETPAERSFEEYYPPIERWLAVDVHPGDDGDGAVVYVRDRTDRRETEGTVDGLERQLDRIRRINSLIATVLGRIIGAAETTEVGRTVCRRLGGTDRYAFAWAGDREFAEDRLRVVATSDPDSELRARLDDALGAEPPLPGVEAVETGESRLVEPIAGDEGVPHGVRRTAFKRGLRSCLAVPLAYQGTVYGVVSVFSDREDGFGEQERAALETLGDVAGFAIRAIRQERLLVADTVTEVTIGIDDETVPFVRAARASDTVLSLEAAVPRGDGAVVCYVGVDDATTAVDDALRAIDAVDEVRWIRPDREPLVQVTVDGRTPTTSLSGWGAKVTSAEYTAESARLTVTAPPDRDVRRMLEALDPVAEETTLIARTERPRDAEPAEAFRDALDERLTERQRTVLRAAYLADYFESPRGSTSEEVAESLGITGPTMLHHLRRAQRKLVGTVLAVDPAVDVSPPD